MDTVAPPPKTLGPSEIARDWGTSRQYAAKCIKAGCPRESLEAARVWRTERTRIFKSAQGGGAEVEVAGATAAINGAEGDGLEDMLARVQGAEREHFRLWKDALSARPFDAAAASAARRAYQDAAKTRVDLEGLVADYLRESGVFVKLPDAQRAIDERLSPLRSALHSLDRVLATELFPEAPQRWRPKIRSVIARHVLPAVAIAKRRVSGPGPSSHGQPAIAA